MKVKIKIKIKISLNSSGEILVFKINLDMRDRKINVKRSIETEKVVQKHSSIDTFFRYVGNFFFVGLFPLMSGFLLYLELHRKDYLSIAIFLFIISLLISSILLLSIRQLGRLRRIPGTSQAQNRAFILSAIEKLEWKVLTNYQQITVISPPWGWLSFHWGRRIVVIYDKEDILVNCTTYTAFDDESPFHWIGDRRLEKELIQEFEKEKFS